MATATLNSHSIRKGKNRTPLTFGHTTEGLIATAIVAGSAALGGLHLIPLDWLTYATVACVLAVCWVGYKSSQYGKIMAETAFSVDDYAHMKPSLFDRVYVSLSHDMSSGR
jgi:hypothetical protein